MHAFPQRLAFAFVAILQIFCNAQTSKLLDVNIADLCVNKCRSQTHTDLSQCDDPTFCDQKCEEGCKLWKSALETSCEKACNVTATIVPKTLYCILGCNDALSLYGMELQSRLGDLPAPALVADSLTATSLRLEWNFPLAIDAGVKYFLQYEEREDAWQYCRNQSWGAQDTVFVDHLEPYTKYRFRVVLLLTERTEPIVSPSSVVISTLPDGVPASPPTKVRAVPVDATRITVSWEPGPFPHGPLLSYVLRITDNQPKGYSALKDLPAETKFFMCKNLNPNSNYTVSISMRNGIGPGPPAVVSVSTPKAPKAKHSEKPILILGANHVVIEQGTDMVDEPVILYNTNNAFITGVAIHVSMKLLFVADSDYNIFRMPLHKYTTKHNIKTKILSAAQMDFLPLDLSMDWLNEHLYILGEVSRPDGKKAWQIARCNLTGGELTVAIAGLLQKPTHFEVDPYNGFLFWGMTSGIYRLDLSDVSNGIKHEVKPFRVSAEKNLGAFTVDHEDFKILVAHQNKNTVISISFDGKEVMNMRPKATRPRFETVLSLATANDILYWTNGKEVYFEEHHPDNNYYFHNSYPLSLSNTYSQVLVNLTSSQSTPIPLNPPINVETIFGTTSARISWQVPHILGWQGKGAWRDWSYDISIKDMTTHNTCYVRDINSTSHTIYGLNEGTEYVIKTLAYTVSGNGPWSTEFVGRTLKSNPDNTTATILWSGIEGLIQSDVTGEHIETIIHSSSNIGANVTDIAWFNDKLFLVTNTSQLVWYNITSRKNGTLSDVDSVRSVSVDWVGQKLYWCNPKQQMIIRGNLNGTQREHIRLNTLAKELHVDSINGYLYWSTGHTLECSRLNGENHFKYHESQMFSGLHVMGMTLDMDHQHIYWIVRGSDHSDLFRAPMAGTVSNPLSNVTEYKLRVSNLTGPLCYFNSRLIWLQDDKSAMISDLEGRNTACMRGKSLLNLNTVYVKDNALHPMPSNTTGVLAVIPAPIRIKTIKIVGTWDSFSIEWEDVTNVNYGTIFYEIKVDTASRNDSTRKATKPSIKYWHAVPPYTKLHISVRAFTYWGASIYTKIKMHSPPSVPQAPCNPRAFVAHDYRSTNSSHVNVTYRWDTPVVTNGILQGYHVIWWYDELSDNMDFDEEKNTNSTIVIAGNLTVEATVRELVVENLIPNNYTFQVSAFTEVGEGDFSESMIVNTELEKPIPKILIAAANMIYLKDMDTFTNETLIQGGRFPIQIGYLYAEQKIFWINDINELAMPNFSRMVEITGSLRHMTVDWLERSIYYMVYNNGLSTIFKLDLNLYERGIIIHIKIVEVPEVITKIEVSPFERTLYWLQWNKDKSEKHLYSSSVSGHNMTMFLQSRSRCDCPKITGSTFTIDRSLMYQTKILYLSSGQIVSTQNGCNCQVVVESVSSNTSSITADFNNIFWADNDLHMFDINIKRSNLHIDGIMANDVQIYGASSQPYPRSECLKPPNINDMKVSMVSRTSNTLTLKMPDYPSPCNTTIATTKYIIYYTEYNTVGGFVNCDETCTKKTTFDTITDIINLRPYTKYIFSVALTNYYTEQDGDPIIIGPGVILQTDAGAPTPPRNVTVDVLNPTLLRVRWEPPAALNGDFVYYEIHWQTEGAVSGVRHKGEQTVVNHLHAAVFSTNLQRVSPNETYSIWIRAYSQTNETSSDSRHVTVTTFSLPDPIILMEATATELRVQWNVSRFVDKFIIQYTLLTSSIWIDINDSSPLIDGDVTEVILRQLKPKTLYKFRLSLKYPLDVGEYIWPRDSRFAFETLGDRPSPPGIPRIQHVKNDVYKVWWEPSKENGAVVIMYNLETLKIPNYRAKRNANRTAWFNSGPYIEEEEPSWESIYNGTDSFWMFSDLMNDYRYSFRVSALNSYGWSDNSEESLQFDLAQAAQMAKKNDLSYVVIPLSITFGIVLIILIGCCWLCNKSKKEDLKMPLRGPDVELATLRELPRILNNTNILYNPNQIPDDISMLPHISRDKITLVKFLGSGAFGEVFQGKAKGLTGFEGETKVAVKTLRKGASDTEKFEFLQEAQLMSHFKHEHILELLGVVLDNDPHYIIMELMEGGDLLTYLRSSRKTESIVGGLNLLDLLKMCVDVSKGCRYLEEMHFVHRDLACRNCLVSSIDPSFRIVKIGDFGLARDIYKNDYYRKEGEGLLPVRWMAPESLVDGVFTCQSDVWAFGVLLWEIMTLGQQPYPARNNLEVLHYVRRGGRLGQPTNCPEVLHNLMLKCWETEPERRPTFKYCLDTLERLHLKMASSAVTGAHIGQYVSTVSAHLDGISNRAYFQDENHNHSAGSVISGSEEETSREQVPFLRANTPRPTPTYLDILQDNDSVVENEGYEVPRSAPYDGECDSSRFEQVVNDLTMIEHLLKPDAGVEYTNMNTSTDPKPSPS